MDFLKGKAVVVGCPKLDDIHHYVEKLAEIFRQHLRDCDLILHAGDLTDLGVLDVFEGKTVKAVWEEIIGLRTEGVTAEELHRVKVKN
jgi:predicted phosphodiesterase